MGILRLALYDVKMLLRSKDVLFWTIAWPIIWMLMVAYVFVPPTPGPATLSITIIDLDNGFSIEELAKLGVPVNNTSTSKEISSLNFTGLNFTKELIKVLEDYAEKNNIKLKLNVIKSINEDMIKCISKGREIIKEKNVDLVIIIPSNASECYTIWAPVRVGILVKASNPTEEYMNIGTILQPIVNMSVRTSLYRINKTLEYIEKYFEFMGNKTQVKFVRYGLYGIAFPIVSQIESVKPKAVEDRPGILGWTTIGALGYIAMLSSMTATPGFSYTRRRVEH